MNNKLSLLTSLTAIMIIVGTSCNLTKKAAEPAAESTFVCDDQITYTNTIKAIFDARCTGCHSGPKPAYSIDLTSHETASKVAVHRLKCVITWEDECNKMPPSGGRLSDLEIKQINCWAENGYRN